MSGFAGVLRLQLLGSRLLVLGWLILAASFAINVALAASIGDQITTGGLTVVFIFAFVAAVQLLVQSWPFAAGLGVGRRRFYGTTVVTGLGVAVASALVVQVLAGIEAATGGWGASLRFFGLAALVLDGLPAQWLATVALFALMWACGLLVAAVGKRWGALGVWLGVGALVVAPGLGITLVTALDGWSTVARWLEATPALGLFVVLPLLLAASAATAGWVVIRRAAP